MKRGATGRYETSTSGGETVRAFIPAPLPPDPRLDLHGERQRILERALLACGRLDGVRALLPDPNLFLYAYVRREAVLSSQIEGTQSSLSDLLLFELDEAPGVPFDDVVEVSNYVAALEHGMAGCAEAFRSPTVCCARCTRSCSGADGERTSSPESFAAARTGWEAPVPATHDSCRLRLSASRTAWPRSSVPSTPGTKVYRYS